MLKCQRKRISSSIFPAASFFFSPLLISTVPDCLKDSLQSSYHLPSTRCTPPQPNRELGLRLRHCGQSLYPSPPPLNPSIPSDAAVSRASKPPKVTTVLTKSQELPEALSWINYNIHLPQNFPLSLVRAPHKAYLIYPFYSFLLFSWLSPRTLLILYHHHPDTLSKYITPTLFQPKPG